MTLILRAYPRWSTFELWDEGKLIARGYIEGTDPISEIISMLEDRNDQS